MTKRRHWMMLGLLLLPVSACSDKDPDGKSLYADKGCIACHGEEGRKPIMAAYPKLAGQNKDYLVIQTKDIRDDRRTNGQAGIMKATISGITDAEIEAISSYLAELD